MTTRRSYSLPAFYVLEVVAPMAEITDSVRTQWLCGTCGNFPGARVGHTAVRFAHKRELADIVSTSLGHLGRDKSIKCLLAAEISGWRQGRVDITAVPKLAEAALDYSEIVIVGQAQNYAREVGLELLFACPECGRKRYERPDHGLVMPAVCWDKTDLFWVNEISLTFATEQARQAIEGCKLTGVRLTPIAEWHDPLYMLKEAERRKRGILISE